MGGSDQWGNMVNGVDLGRRVEKAELFALTAPLITTSEGKKMGKSASGAVWLNSDMLSSYDYWQVSYSFSVERGRINMVPTNVAPLPCTVVRTKLCLDACMYVCLPSSSLYPDPSS